MLSSQFRKIVVENHLLLPKVIFTTHSPLCPTQKKLQSNRPVCPSSKSGSKGSGGGAQGSKLQRAEKSGKVRLFFIPEEWFQFFHSKTGVTGPYVFGLVVANYAASKEIFIMEHEYYLGLSWLVVMSCAVKFLGPGFAAAMDKDIDDLVEDFEKSRKSEIDLYEGIIKSSKDAMWRAEGQKALMDAKKENIMMQLEAAYRERFMLVYKNVRGRMDYHVKRYNAESRIHQKWMIGWILENVRKSITPEFEKQALDAAIRDLGALTNK